MSRGTCCAAAASAHAAMRRGDNRHEGKPHHRRRPRRRRRAVDRVRPSAPARSRGEPAPRSRPAKPSRRSCSASPSSTPTSCRTAASSCCPAAPRPTSKVDDRSRAPTACCSELKVRRGSHVKKGDVIAVLSDEAREAQVLQAQGAGRCSARPSSRPSGSWLRPAHDAEARLDQPRSAVQGRRGGARGGRGRARPRRHPRAVGRRHHRRAGRGRQRGVRRSPARRSRRSSRSIRCWRWSRCRSASSPASRSATRPRSGSSPARPREGQHPLRLQVRERGHAHLSRRGRDCRMPTARSPTASPPRSTIPLAPVPATRVPRSALTFSSAGDIGVRTVDARRQGRRSCRSTVVEDEQTVMWVAGVPDGARVIVQGQDFVREGQTGRAGRRRSRPRPRSADGRRTSAMPCRSSSITPSATRG